MNAKINSSQANWLIDIVLYTAFLLAFFIDLTGLALHQWVGAAAGALAGYHMIRHWAWIKAVTTRFFKRTSGQARWYYLVDSVILLSFITMLVTGLAISTWFNLELPAYTTWLNVHIMASLTTLAAVVFKIGLHWRWIVSVAQRAIFAPDMPKGAASPQATIPVSTGINRREFLKLMGLAGAAAAVASLSALDNFINVQAQTETSSSPTSTSSQAADQTTTAETTAAVQTTTSACSVRCHKGCSFPGHCDRYVDSNQNQRCDLGECL